MMLTLMPAHQPVTCCKVAPATARACMSYVLGWCNMNQHTRCARHQRRYVHCAYLQIACTVTRGRNVESRLCIMTNSVSSQTAASSINNTLVCKSNWRGWWGCCLLVNVWSITMCHLCQLVKCVRQVDASLGWADQDDLYAVALSTFERVLFRCDKTQYKMP